MVDGVGAQLSPMDHADAVNFMDEASRPGYFIPNGHQYIKPKPKDETKPK